MDRLDAAIRAENDPDMFAVFPLDVRRVVASEPMALIGVAQGFGINTDGLRLTENKPSTVQEINDIANNMIADPTHRFRLNLHPASFGEVLIAIFQKRIDFVTTGQLRKSRRNVPKRKKPRKSMRLGKRKV